jgi:hypothetical protein
MCFAAGNQAAAGRKFVMLAERWDGTKWIAQPVSSAASVRRSELVAISCPANASCTAVGSTEKLHSRLKQSLSEQWNGSVWRAQLMPGSATGTPGDISSVSCASSTSCVAVGSIDAPGGAVTTLVERWNGTGWMVEPSQNPAVAPHNSELHGVSCVSSTSCIAVGWYRKRVSGKKARLILVERYS